MSLIGFTLAALCAGALVAWVITPLAASFARRSGLLDQPDVSSFGRKAHARPTPYLGGLAIFAGLLAGLGLLLIGDHPSATIERFLGGIAIALALGAVGLVDDIRPLPPIVRFLCQIAAAGGAFLIGFGVQTTPWDVLNVVVSLVWIVGITNAFNLLDNMDGLSAGLAAVGGLGFTAMGVLSGLTVVAVVAAAVSGAALGFLVHNRHPAKVFMGDAGSLFLGFTLALIGIELRFRNLEEVTFLVPVVVLGLPIFDTTLVILSRVKHGRPVWTGARDHISHRLVRVGLPVPAAVGLLYWSAICLAWLALVISRSDIEVGWMLLGFVIALGIYFGALLWRVPVYDSTPEEIPATHWEAEILDQTTETQTQLQ